MLVEVKRSTHIQALSFDEFEQRVRDGEVPPDTLVRFEVVTGREFRRAGDLELYQATADPGRLAFRRNLSSAGLPIVTALIIGMQLRAHLWSHTADRRLWLQETFANWGPALIERGEVWRLFTYSLLHSDLGHLLMNGCFLVYTGYHLERAAGRVNLVAIYTGAVVSGGLMSAMMSPERYSLGASGGVWGLIGATIVLGWKHWDEIPESARKYFGWALLPYLMGSAMSGLQNAAHTDNWCHLGGLLGGVMLATVLDPEVFERRKQANRRWLGVALAVVAAAMGALLVAGTHLVPLTVEDDGAWQVPRPSYWQAGWTSTGDRGWGSPTLQAKVGITRTIHPSPLTETEAADALVRRLSAGAQSATVERREPVSVDGVAGERLQVRFSRTDTDKLVDALVLVRGRTEHRLVLQTDAREGGRYAPLMTRMLEGVTIEPDAQLARAERRVSVNPRSWESYDQLAQARSDVGNPDGAMAAFDQALEVSPGEPTVLAHRLDACTTWVRRAPLDCDVVLDDALSQARDHPVVVVAAADYLDAAGRVDEATALLHDAWALLPGDRTLRRARRRRGLSLELPEP